MRRHGIGSSHSHAAFVLTFSTPSSQSTQRRKLNHEDAKDTKKTGRATGPLAGREGTNGAATQTTAIERL